MLPVGQFLGRLNLSPNMLSILSLLASALSGWSFYSQNLVLGAFFIIVTGVVDMLDGAVARATGKTTMFGAVMDHVLDRYAEYLIIMGIVLSNYVDWILGIFTLVGMLLASFTRAKAESIGGLKSCTVGVAERQEKLIILIVGSFFSIYYFGALSYAVLLVGGLSHFTVIQRLEYTWKQTKGE